MKRFLFSVFVSLCALAGIAEKLPAGSKILYKSEQRFERYGRYWQQFIVYESEGKTYLQRNLSFKGSLEIVTDAEGIARNAPQVTLQLSKKQINKLREEIKKCDFIGKTSRLDDEKVAFAKAVEKEKEINRKKSMRITPEGDTLYVLQNEPPKMHFHSPSMCDVIINWEGVATGVKSINTFYNEERTPKTWYYDGRPARKALVGAVSNVNSLLDEWAYKYKLRHAYEDEMFEYSYSVSGGMTARRSQSGKLLRQGRRIALEQKEGKWILSGYIDEREDTLCVDKGVARKVEKMVRKLNFGALKPKLKAGDKLLKLEATDSPYWEVFVGYRTLDNIREGDDIHSSIKEPEYAAKEYDKLLKDIEAINNYLLGFLKL